jgi:hypothetical protein
MQGHDKDCAPVEDWTALMRMADDALRLRSLLAPYASVAPIPLVITLSALHQARQYVGPHACELDVLARIMEVQDFPMPVKIRPQIWARGILQSIRGYVVSGTSMAQSSSGYVFVNSFRVPGLCSIMKQFVPLAAAVRMAVDFCLLHEFGHIVEKTCGHMLRLSDHRLIQAPPDAGFDSRRLQADMRWHSEECFADSFAASAALAAGWMPTDVAAEAWCGVARGLDKACLAFMDDDSFWKNHSRWRGIYFTALSVSLVLRNPPRVGCTPQEVIHRAQRAARRGALPADVMLEIAAGQVPEWLGDFDTTAILASALATMKHPSPVGVRKTGTMASAGPGEETGDERFLGWLAGICLDMEGGARLDPELLARGRKDAAASLDHVFETRKEQPAPMAMAAEPRR